MPGLRLRDIYLVVLVLQYNVAAYSSIPRWGQATVILDNALFIHGGKTDQDNQFSYTSAQTNNDIIRLSLVSPFDASSPPWELINSSSTFQGPAVAWHTLAAFNTSQALSFGGLPGPNSPTVVFGQPDSALLFDVSTPSAPQWVAEGASWANEPTRRIHHSTSSTGGKIYLIGGEKADGSNIDISFHYVFDINGPSFTLLPSTNGPPDLSGHTSLVLSNGQLIVFGGYCGSQAALLPLTTIWALDTTQSTLSWTVLSISTNSVPNPRRGFAAVVLGDGKVLIHGGSDSSLQSSFSDGWILDTTQNPMAWSQVDALTQLGPRRDHFAIVSGTQVIFGFGYGINSGADATLRVFDTSSGSWTSSFTPPTTSATNTLPAPTQTTGSGPGGGSPVGGSSSITGTGTATSGDAHPTSSVVPGTSNGTNPNTSNAHISKSHTSAIAVGTTFGVLALIATGLATVYFVKKRDGRMGRFRAIGGEDGLDGDGNGSIPNLGGMPHTAGAVQEKRSGWLPRSSLPSLGLGLGILASGGNTRAAQQRRDMLADEDTRQFDPGSFYGTGAGSVGSTWSLRSVGAMMRGIRSREASTSSTPRAGSPWREKSDPFSDGAVLVKDEEIGLVGAGAGAMTASDVRRPPDRREMSYSSVRSALSYTDPFAESISEEPRQELRGRENGEPNESARLVYPHIAHPPPIETMLPLSTNIHILSPLQEGTSINTVTDPSASSDEHHVSPFDSSSRGASSYTSLDSPKVAPRPHRSSIIDANPSPNRPMSRSNSWWARFSRTSFLDRSDSKPHSRVLDIRDPNPPPRLVAIEESTHSQSPDSPQGQNFRPGSGSDHSRRNSRVYNGAHGKSMSSLQTTKTADSEAIERMGGTMVVVQRDTSGGHRMSASNISMSSTGGRATPDVSIGMNLFTDEQGTLTVASPKEMTPTEPLPSPVSPALSRLSSMAETPSVEHRSSVTPGSGKRPPSSSAVAARIQAYERRMSQDSPSPPLSPEGRNTKQREERTKKIITINYGLAPRQSLFVANPDHSATSSANS